MKTKILFVVLVVALLTSSNIYSQDGTRLIGFDAKTIGRGGTITGFFDDPALMMTNPAGLSFISCNLLDVDFSLMAPSLKFTNTINSASGNKNYYPLPSAGITFRPKKSKFTYGFGVYTQGGMGSDFMLNHALFVDQNGNYVQQSYYSKFAVIEGGPSVSYLISKKFSVGISAHLVYSQMDFRMPYSLSPSVMAGVVNPQTGMTFGQMFSAPQSQGGLGYNEVTAYAHMSGLKAFSFGGKIGLAYKVSEKFSVGAGYSLPVNLYYKNGIASMDMTYQMNDAFGRVVSGYMQHYPGITQQQAKDSAMTSFSQMGIDLSKGAIASYDLENKLSLPQSFTFGFSYFPNKKLRMAFDFEWLNWKKAFENMQLSLSNGANANINRMMGNSGSMNINFPMDWKDSYLFHVGAEYDITRVFTIRAGYAYGTNPVPESTVFPVFPAIVENHITAGATYSISKRVDINFAYEMALNKRLTASDPSLIASEYNNSTSELQTMLFHLSCSWKF